MHYVFAPFSLYPGRAELVGTTGPVHVEPKAFALLCLLVEHHDRVVSREEMIEVVWGGRFVSDAAVSTALKSARKALGDDGERQAYIRTIHGAGHRFVADVERRVDASVATRTDETTPQQTDRRPTIAVLPFVQDAQDGLRLGDGLADEIISSLAKLRWLRVIARESSFRFRRDEVDLQGMRQILGAGYVLTGRVDVAAGRVNVAVTLIETQAGSVVWADRISPVLDDLHQARQEITAAVIGALDLQISQAEAATARTKSTEMLDAWGAYHLGMSHLVRFNPHDNVIASSLFERATQLDPGFATAFAARSFAKHQEAAQAYSRDISAIIPEMRRLAERAIELDPFDPFANMVMGRVHLLSDRPDDGLFWYDRSTQVSPNFVKGHYSRGIVDALAGRSDQSRSNFDTAMRLSPMDPLLCVMLAGKALSYFVDGKLDMAREQSLQATRSNQSHYLVIMTAALMSHMAGDSAEAQRWARHLLDLRPGATAAPYLLALHFSNADTRAMVGRAFRDLGIPD